MREWSAVGDACARGTSSEGERHVPALGAESHSGPDPNAAMLIERTVGLTQFSSTLTCGKGYALDYASEDGRPLRDKSVRKPTEVEPLPELKNDSYRRERGGKAKFVILSCT